MTHSSESLHEDPSQFQGQPTNDLIKTHCVLETRPHNEAEQLISGTEAPEFCAARLPVMGGASPAVDHLDMMYCQQYKHSMGNPIIRFPWVVTPAPPVITTVNPLVVPKMICRPYEFDWSPIWSGFDHGHERLTCWTDDNLVFPKLSGSGSTGCEMESLSGNEDGVLAGVCSGDLMGERHGTCETVTTPSLCRDKAYSSRSSSF